MSRWVSSIDSDYYWYVSGTPFVNYTGVKNCAKFINLKLEDSNREFIFDFTNNNYLNQSSFLINVIGKEYIWQNILDKICIRHRKIDVENQINIPGYQERLVWLKFTDLERQLYESKKNKVSEHYLQQLCCHPLIVESTKKIFGDTEVDLSLMQDKLIEFHKQNYQTYTLKLSKLINTNQAYHMLKKQYETIATESKYMLNILEKMKSEDKIEDNCAICLDCIDKPTLTACGHLFCYTCLKMCLDNKKLCPLCKTNLEGKDILVMNKKKENQEIDNPLIQKYGSKLGKLISVIRHLVAQDETRIIIFSQWDDMLNLIGKTLAMNEIDNCFVKGNVWARNSAIQKFKMGKTSNGIDNKVIMLSLKNAASGTNLSEATHIFFVEPINSSRDEIRAIEGQAIARACRVGQKQQIILSRILIENTIEEDIYRNNYNKDIMISFEEQDFMISPQTISPVLIKESKSNTRSKKTHIDL
jgi:SNF2 family DNA or RNA helicase